MLPLAVTMAFSRVYLGVHYPSDAIAGAILGAGYAIAGLWGLNNLWRWVGQKWFPIWWNRLPSLIEVPGAKAQLPESPDPTPARNRSFLLADLQWLRLGYLTIAVLLVVRLFYLASGEIELSEDEAYQWIWSKHLALSYFSKPPMIAWLQFLGTTLWGDTAFGVRFFSPVISAVLGVMILRFFSQQVNVRAGFFLLLVLNCTPLLSAGSVLMTIDPPLVLFWTAAMFAGWRAVRSSGTTSDWLGVGLWAGLGFLSKYSAMFLAGCFALYFILQPAARVHLRRPGPWLGLLIFVCCTIPVIVWNSQNGWITIDHISDNAKLDKPWQPTLQHFADFTGQELGLLNPVFFVASLIAAFSFWKRARQTPLLLYFFAMGAPVFFGYWLYTLHSRVQGNWIAPAVVPLLGLMGIYWEQRWREGLRAVQGWFLAGLVFGAIAVVLFHDTDLVYQVVRTRLPVEIDPLRRVRGISNIAQAAGQARNDLAAEGRETFIIASHYGLTGQITFYLPEARNGLPGSPLVYVRSAKVPKNQFYFWPEYRYTEHRKGQNAIYVTFNDTPEKAPAALTAEFESVTDLGIREIKYGRRVFHRVQLFACRNLR
jgi:4-amino-4-deoxy-L-arabinose transferase-like glycosyltransferase